MKVLWTFEIFLFKPFAVTPKYDCPHLGERTYLLINMTKQEEKQQPPCNDCGQTQENWICAHENCQYVSSYSSVKFLSELDLFL